MATRSSKRIAKKASSSIVPVIEEPEDDLVAQEEKPARSKKRKVSQLTEKEESIKVEEHNPRAMEKKTFDIKRESKRAKTHEDKDEPRAAKHKAQKSTSQESNSAVASAFNPTESTQEATQALLKLYKRLTDSKIEEEGYSGTQNLLFGLVIRSELK